MPRYTPSTEMPTANDKIVNTTSVVRSTIQGNIKQGDERPRNHGTTCSGDQMKITDLKRGKAERPVFLDPQSWLCKMSSGTNIGLIDDTVNKTSLRQISILAFQEKGILVSWAAG